VMVVSVVVNADLLSSSVIPRLDPTVLATFFTPEKALSAVEEATCATELAESLIFSTVESKKDLSSCGAVKDPICGDVDVMVSE